MRPARDTTRRLLCAACGRAFTAASSGCSYLDWRREESEQRSALEKSPANPRAVAGYPSGHGRRRLADHGPSPAGDGTIALPSQLNPRVQSAATRMTGYGDTHVGILSDPAALTELSRELDETSGGARPERTAAR
jgi:hypothetical protein